MSFTTVDMRRSIFWRFAAGKADKKQPVREFGGSSYRPRGARRKRESLGSIGNEVYELSQARCRAASGRIDHRMERATSRLGAFRDGG